MRARNIKPGFFKNPELADAGPIAQLLFAGLWCMADKEGRLKDQPRVIKAEVFPFYDVDVNGELTVLERIGLIHRYSAGSIAVIAVDNFKRHQSPHHTEKASELPAPVSSPLSNGGNPSDSLIPDSLIPDSSSLREPKKATDVAGKNSEPGGSANNPPKTSDPVSRRDEAKRLWPRVIAAIQHTDLQKAFPPDSEVGKAVNLIGGWQSLGRKNRDLRGQTEQQFLNAYAGVS